MTGYWSSQQKRCTGSDNSVRRTRKKDWNKEDIDWNAIDSELISKHIVISRPEINGKKLGSLRLRNTYGINISRVLRSGVQLLATPELVLQLGDRLTVVGEAAAIKM